MNKLTEDEIVEVNREIQAANEKWKASEKATKAAYDRWTDASTAESRARTEFFDTMARATTWIMTGNKPEPPPEPT